MTEYSTRSTDSTQKAFLQSSSTYTLWLGIFSEHVNRDDHEERAVNLNESSTYSVEFFSVPSGIMGLGIFLTLQSWIFS